jgi:hypothetical protein
MLVHQRVAIDPILPRKVCDSCLTLQRFGDATLYAGISMQHKEVECCQYAVSHVVYGLRLTDLAVCTHTSYAHAHA